jgi:pilus assembly protein Flp/PilA
MMAMGALFRSYLIGMLDDEAGQTMAEYGLLIAVIAIVVVIAAVALGGSISSLFGSTSGKL